MERWVRHLARVLGLIIVGILYGVTQGYIRHQWWMPAWFFICIWISSVCVFACLAGIVLSSLPPKKPRRHGKTRSS